MSRTPIKLDELLTPKQVAEYRKTSEAVLAQKRYRRVGPKFIRDGRRIRYSAKDIAEYLDANTVRPDQPPTVRQPSEAV